VLRWFKRLFWLSVAGGIISAVVYGFMPKPIPVDTARVTRGTLSVTVNEDGKTRLRDRYIISAPLAGRLHRISVRPGDSVETPLEADFSPMPVATDSPLNDEHGGANGNGNSDSGDKEDTPNNRERSSKTPGKPREFEPAGFSLASGQTTPWRELAVIDPLDPGLLDSRQITQAELRVKAAESTVKNAGATRERASLALEWATVEWNRKKKLKGQGASASQELEDAEMSQRTRNQELNAAKFSEEIAKYELEVARAALLRSRPLAPEDAEKWQLRLVSPINGVVLRVLQESETVVQVGTPLIEVGDPRDLEVEIDVLSTDAVKIRPGQAAWLEHWGGDRPLSAHVRLVEPQGFLKLSSLGVEEQRVHVIAVFDEAYDARPTLGDGYRVEAKVVIWEMPDVVKVPTGALFREGDDWAVFIVDGEHARKCRVEIGRRNGLEAEVLSGLREQDKVIVHPSDRIQDQTAVRPR
jgi:HlyD family secretion protein